MKKLISVFLALVIAFTYFAIDTSAAKYSVKVKQIYNNGYTYVTLTPSTGTVYYTTDGTEPIPGDTLYTGSFTAPVGTNVKAVALAEGCVTSNVATATVVFIADDVTPY